MSVDVSVVIPTRDRPASLGRLLGALRRQSLDTERFEVVVVDDGSSPPVAVDPRGLLLRVLRHERPRGPGAARNSGWREASAGTIAFIDDDCVPAEGWLEALLRAAETPQVVVQGRIAPMPGQAHLRHPLSHTIEVVGASRLFVSANIAYSRALLERVGGFDERLRKSGEDAELGARATQAGAVARYAADALVYHQVRDLSLAAHIRHTWKWTDAPAVLAMHPELRGLLTLRLFWKPTHPWLIAAMLAIAARRPRLGAVAAFPYLLRYRRVYGGDLRALARALPTHLAIDTCEIATALAGSVRHGTLML